MAGIRPSPNSTCASCGQPRGGPYCTYCGQDDRVLTRPLIPLLRELLAEAFELDSRLLRTLRGVWLPGFLTAEFCRGRRAAYTSPVRLYLFSSLLCFSLLALTGGGDDAVLLPDNAPASRADFVTSLQDPATLRLLASLSADDLHRFVDLQRRRGIEDAAELLEQTNLQAVDATPANALEALIQREFSRVLLFVDSPAAARAAVLDNLPVATLLLLPLYALLLKVLYMQRLYIEHLVLSVHLHVVLLLLVSLGIVLPDGDGQLAAAASTLLWLALLTYQLLALRHMYGYAWWPTVWRFGVLTTGYLVLLGITAGLLFVYTMTVFE